MRALTTAAAIALVLGLGAGAASANHSWGGYHWPRSSNPVTLTYLSNLTGTWPSFLSTSMSQWSMTSGSCNNSQNPIRCTVGTGSAGRNCRPNTGEIQVCNASYGNNGWLGIAGLWVSGTHITKGYVKLNDYYFALPQYNTPAWRQMVCSQETGHILGLDHQDTNFNNADLLDACGRGSCMDYSNDPTNQSTPNQHDYDELVTIYSHLDAAAPAAMLSPADNAADVGEDPSAWGQAIRFDEKGRGLQYERVLPNGDKVITFVTWAN